MVGKFSLPFFVTVLTGGKGMNYCPRCGAYIPEGYTDCLACGYSANAKEESPFGKYSKKTEQSSTAGANAQATAQASESSEYHYSKEQSSKKTEHYEYGTTEENSDQQKVKDKFEKKTKEIRDADEYQSVSYLSYLGPLFIIPYLMCKQSPFAMFHARQGMKLFLLEILVNACWGMGFFGVLAALAGTVLAAWCIINGLLNVSQKKKRPLPVIGKLGRLL